MVAVAQTIVTEQPKQSNSCSNEDINKTKNNNAQSENYLAIPSTSIATSNSLDTLTESTLSGPSSPSNLSSVTLVGSTGSGGQDKIDVGSPTDETKEFKYGTAPTAPLPERKPKFPTKNCDVVPKESIVTYALPPTVTTTHYTEPPDLKHIHSIDEDNPPLMGYNKSRTPSIVSTGLLPHGKLIMDRRPSAGANIIPHAALCQHRHSLQLNGEPSGLIKVSRNET